MALMLIINPSSSSKKLALCKNNELILESHLERLADGFEMGLAVNGVQQKCELLPKESFRDSLINFLLWLKIKKFLLIKRR